MKKVLFAANLDSFYLKFLIPELKWFKEHGYEVHIASKNENIEIPYIDKKFDVDFARGINLKQIVKSYKQMMEIFKNNNYDIVSCHTPFGGAITRYAFKKCKIKDTLMVYMAHGFHFYKGSPIINWLVYYQVEKYLAKYTDRLITINLDDYEIAKKHFKTDVYYVKGIGLPVDKFAFAMSKSEKKDLRKSLGLKSNDFVMIYPAEINKNKRQMWLVDAVEKLLKENKNMHILLPGKDLMNGKCQKLVEEKDLSKQIHFLGFRNDIPKLLNIADLSVTTSKREGLPVNVMEAIYVGLPVVATSCRGNRDLIKNNKNGYIVDINDKEDFVKKILKVYNMDQDKRKKIKEYDQIIIKDYLLDNVLKEIIDIHIR